MQEELITLQTTILAKEKGFNIRCEKSYFETLKHTLETSRDGEITFQYQPPRILKRNYGDEFTIFIAEAPTQSLLQKWLRAKHKILVTMQSRFFPPKENPIMKHTYNGINGLYNDKWYDTYEQALEVGLQEGLKLIK